MNNNKESVKQNGKISAEKNTASKTNSNDILNGIVFAPRNSPLTDLFEKKHGTAFYYTFVAITLCLLWNVLLESYILEQKEITGIRQLVRGFQNFHLAFLAWLIVFATVLLAFKCYNIWAEKRLTLKGQSCKQWDWFWIATLVLYYLAILHLVSKSVHCLNLPFVTATAYQVDCVRLLMKVHSFVRNSAPEVIEQSKALNASKVKVSKEFNRFLYFLFVPTLIYKDEYPRTQTIRWRFVITCVLNFVLVITLAAIIADLHLYQPFEKLATEPLSRKQIILYLLRCNFAGVILMMCISYIVFQTFQNFFAELTRFADREYYQDWWCTSDLSQFLKTWNVVVYQWLFVYIYKELYNNVYQNRNAAKAMVVFISAVIHDLIVTSSMGIFFPLQSVMFYFSAVIARNWIKTKDENMSQIIARVLFMWGSGLLMTACYLEFRARYFLPVVNDDTFNFIPRCLSLIA